MAIVYETQTFIVDPEAAPVVNTNLSKDFSVLEVAIITNTVLSNGKREITLGIVYNDGVTAQGSISIETITVGQNIAAVTDQALSDIQTIGFVEFLEHTISGDTMSVSIISISTAGAQVNEVTTKLLQLDPSAPITVGSAVLATGTLKESHIVNVGSLSRPSTTSFGQGTLNSVILLVAQS